MSYSRGRGEKAWRKTGKIFHNYALRRRRPPARLPLEAPRLRPGKRACRTGRSPCEKQARPPLFRPGERLHNRLKKIFSVSAGPGPWRRPGGGGTKYCGGEPIDTQEFVGTAPGGGGGLRPTSYMKIRRLLNFGQKCKNTLDNRHRTAIMKHNNRSRGSGPAPDGRAPVRRSARCHIFPAAGIENFVSSPAGRPGARRRIFSPAGIAMQGEACYDGMWKIADRGGPARLRAAASSGAARRTKGEPGL